ncbi:MAG: hypothetical protein ABSE56_19130 [Bryobacteraceae bacterium]
MTTLRTMELQELKPQAVIWLLAASLAVGGCSSKPPESGGTGSAKLERPKASPQAVAAPAKAPAPDFDVTGAWRPKKVVIKMHSVAGLGSSPAMEYAAAVRPKAGAGLLAVELTLKQQRRTEPYRAKAVLIDSSGERRASLFGFPSALTAYKVNGDSIIYDNDNSRSLGRKLSELGGKQISVFEVPAGRSGFKVEIDGSSPIAVEGKLRR